MARVGSNRALRSVRLSRFRRTASLLWPALVLAFLALGIQNLVVQPHIHAQPTDEIIALDVSDGDGEAPGNVPIERGQSDCPMCQTTHQHEQYLRSSSTAFAPPARVNYRVVDGVQRSSFYEAISHSWQGRAPPQA
jgi:hypothetical protein